MKKWIAFSLIFSLAFILCLPADVFPQSASIKNLAEARAKADEAIEFGDNGDFKSALELFSACKSFYQTKGWYSEYLEVAIEEGLMYAYAGDRAETIQTFGNNLADIPETDSLSGSYGNYYHKFGVACYLLDDFNYARTNFLNAINYREKELTFPDINVARSYHNLGVVEKYMGQFQKAKDHLEKALDHRKRLENPGHTADTYTELGDIAESQGDYREAISFHRSAIPLFEQAYGSIDSDVAAAFYAIANIQESLGNPVESKKAFTRAIDLYKQLNDAEKLADCQAGLGIIEYKQGKQSSAKGYYELAIKAYSNLEEVPQYKLANVLNNLGLSHRQSGNFESSFEAQNQAFEIRKSLYQDRIHPDMAASYDNLANLFSDQSDFKQAYYFFGKAFEQLIPEYQAEERLQLPGKDQLSGIRNKPYLLEVLSDLAEAQLKENQLNPSQKALETYQFAAEVMDLMRGDQYGQESKLFWLASSRPLFEKAIAQCYGLYQKTQDEQFLVRAWAFSEKNKAVLLLESLQVSQAIQFSNLSDSLISVYHDLNQKVLNLEEQLNQKVEDDVFQKIKSNWIVAEGELSDFIGTHFGRSNAKAELSLSDQERFEALQETLSESASFIAYFDGTEHLSLFRISNTGIRMHQIEKTQDFDASLFRFLGSIFNKPKNISLAFEAYQRDAVNWYQSHLMPVFGSDEIPEELIIAPDGLLNYLPFEVLVTEKSEIQSPDFRALNYLMKQATCTYTYSAQLWLQNKRASQNLKGGSTVLGMAPSYTQDSRFLPLPGARGEVETLKDSYKNTRLILGNEASQDTFLNIVSEETWKLIHLAMHGVVDSLRDSQSYLAFTENQAQTERRLFAYQIAGLDIKSGLVVLSACETGTGQLKRGEGVFSLARSFMSAGVPSVVMSLWNTNDQATQQIMSGFHQQLSEGKSKSKALQTAKLAYLDDPIDPIGHPSYWAPLVLLGDEVSISNSGNKKFLVAGLVMVSFLFLFTIGMLLDRINHLKKQKMPHPRKGMRHNYFKIISIIESG